VLSDRTATLTGAMASARSERAAPDEPSRRWPDALAPGAPDREAALARLHSLLLRAARFEVSRRRGALGGTAGPELDDLAHQAADDALVAVLRKLDDFKGASRFETWAYKFAILEAAVRVRRHAWRGREVVLDAEGWPLVRDAAKGPAERAEQDELMRAITAAIQERLTPHQRDVLVAVAVNGVPIDVLADRLGTTRGALYKTLHDARRRLRASLASAGFDPLAGPEGGA
jgi:RNA polymerase sigma-70 factor, ECF subfamily